MIDLKLHDMVLKNAIKSVLPNFLLRFVQARKIPSIYLGVVSSYLGMRVAFRHATQFEPTVWKRDFANRRVLIVGTGPSLDHVDAEYFADFDVLICVNHAILHVPEHPCIYYLSTDAPRTYDVLNTEAAEKIKALALERRILFLSFVLSAPYLLSNFFNWFTVVRYRTYALHKWGASWLSRKYYQPIVASDLEVEYWLNGASSLKYIPARGGSSAFSAIMLAARYRPSEIRLIGVDLSTGRASALRQITGPTAFSGNWARCRFLRLEKLVRQSGIQIENDSWRIPLKN